MSIESAIRGKVERALQPTYLELENESHTHNVPKGSETHFRLVVVSDLFEGKSRIDRQRMVNDLLADERAQGLHALTMRTFTSPEWAQAQPTFEMTSPACRGGSKN